MQVMAERSLQQRRMDALEAANRIRFYRAQVKRDLKARRVTAPSLLLDPPPELGSMKVLELLLAVPKVGRVKAQKYLRREGVSTSRTISGMSPRQRQQLAVVLGRMSATGPS